MPNQRWRIHVRGRVQGVFYRASALEAAQRFGVTGFVRNRRNGQVEVVAEGDETQLNALLEWCRHGPPSAQVAAVDCAVEPATGKFPDFDIAPTE